MSVKLGIEIPRDIHQRGFCVFSPSLFVCVCVSLASSERFTVEIDK